ncbi:MAG: hypothetical protein AB1894_05605 [Chloroflexota bacterium]
MSMIGEIGRNYARSLAISVISILIFCPLACLLIFLPLWIVNDQNLSIWYLIIPAGLFLLILFGGGFGALALTALWRARQLDALFVPLGLKGESYATFFRRYSGDFGGRQVRIYFSRGPLVEIEVATALQTRLSVTDAHAERRALAKLFNQAPVVSNHPALPGLSVYSIDQAWAQNLIEHPEVPALLRRLLALQGNFTMQYLVLRPGWLRLTLFGSRRLLDFGFDLTAQQARQYLEDLSQCIANAENLPAPQVTESETPLERTAEKVRSRNPYLVPLITVAVTLGSIFCISAVIIAAVMLFGN